MKNYLKTITKSLYQKVQRVVEDEYIQPITETQIYGIINRKRTSTNKLTKNNKLGFDRQISTNQQILDNIQRLTLVTPQREFKLIGQEYSLEVINYRLKQLKTKNQSVKQHMLNNYSNNLHSIQSALMHIENIKNLTKTKQKSNQLKQKIQKLKSINQRTMQITKLNIKLKNIKNLLKIAQKIPNVMKMSLFQLKNINLQQIKQFQKSILVLNPNSQEDKLQCVCHLQFFIDKASSQHLRQIINLLTQCLTLKFENHKYQKAIKDFIVSKSNIQFQKLLIRLVETEIRDKIQQQISKSDNKNALFLRCQSYITILINIFKIFRWHRYNLAVLDVSQEIQEKIRTRQHSVVSNKSDKSEEKYPVINLDTQASIKINTQQIKNHVCGLMDHCLKQQIQEVMFTDMIKNQEIFQLLVLVDRFYRIAFSFSCFVFTQSKSQIKQILMRKCYKLQQKGVKQFNEALSMEEGHQWNRLPVLKNFRHKNLEKTLQKIKRLFLYDKVPSLSSQNFKFLNSQYTSENQENFQLEVAHNKEESFQLVEFKFPFEKFEKMLSFEQKDSELPQHQDSQVVLCQSSICILNNFDSFLGMYFYFPIQEIRNDILDKMSFYIEYYVFYIIQTFLSDVYKKIFFEKYDTVEQKYLQVRTRTIYRKVYSFVRNFNKHKENNHNEGNLNGEGSSKRTRKMSIQMSTYHKRGFSFIKKQVKQSKVITQNMVKARAMATDSVKFVLAYFKNILRNLQKYTTSQMNQMNEDHKTTTGQQINQMIQKIDEYYSLQYEVSDLLLTDIVPTTTKIDFVIPIMKKIKWHEIEHSKQILEYGTIILKNFKETYDKMKSMSKGQIPYYLVDKIFSFYWKTQLTYLAKAFLDEHSSHKQKGGKNSKLAFEKLLDILYEGLIEFLDDRHRNKQSSSSKSILYEHSQKRLQSFKSSYIKIKNVFPILLQPKWTTCKQMVQKTLKSFEFVYKIQIGIVKASQSSSGLSSNQMQERQYQIDNFISSQILK